MNSSAEPTFVICLRNDGYEASLEVGKVYRAAAAEALDPRDSCRVVDESGEDYLFPASWFVGVALPDVAVEALLKREAA